MGKKREQKTCAETLSRLFQFNENVFVTVTKSDTVLTTHYKVTIPVSLSKKTLLFSEYV